MGCWEWCALFSFLLFRARALCTRAVAAHMRAAPYLKAPRLATPPLPPPPHRSRPQAHHANLNVADENFGALTRGRFHATEPNALAGRRLELPAGLQKRASTQEACKGRGGGGVMNRDTGGEGG
jgi:hypothetical protein